MFKSLSKKHNPIPHHAKKVFHGERWQVMQWDQELFDGTTKIYESLKRADSASVLPVLDNNKIIIIEEHQPHWKEKAFSIAGGNIDEGENPLDGAKRELFEETGMIFKDFYLVSIMHPLQNTDYTHYTYVAKNLLEQKEVLPDAGEKTVPIEISFEELILLARKRVFHFNPHLIDEAIIRDQLPEFFDMLRNPEKHCFESNSFKL